MQKIIDPTDTLVTLVDYYLENYAAASTHTARAKKLDLDIFLTFLLKRNKAKHVKDITVADWSYSAVQAFVDDMLQRGVAPATVSRRLASIKHFGRIIAEEYAGFQNPSRRVKAPKVEIAQPKALSSEEIKECMQQARNLLQQKPDFKTLRNVTILELLFDTGLRADEIRMLRRNQLSEDFQWLTNVKTKARRYRNVYVSEGMREKLREYLSFRKELLTKISVSLSGATDNKLPFFISTHKVSISDPDSFFLSPKTLYRAVKQTCTEFKLHPHLLRHTFAMDLLRSSNDIRLVSQALGHADIKITMRYTQRKDEEVAGAIEKARRSR